MLSYMIPEEEKPKNNHNFQLDLTQQNDDGSHVTKMVSVAETISTTTTNDKDTRISLTSSLTDNNINGKIITSTPIITKETSISSFISDTTATASHSSVTPTSTSTDKGKPKINFNGAKHQSFKRVSFGSSKGSMVETLIFESPSQEKSEPSPIQEDGNAPFNTTNGCDKEDEREKVRVTFFQQSKPLEVDLLVDDPPSFRDFEFVMSSPVLKNDADHCTYNRTESNESGWDNPFRPGGALSQEADQIVELIKGGKPITPTPDSQAPPLPTSDSPLHQNHSIGDNVDAASFQKTADQTLNATPSANQSALTKNGTSDKNSNPRPVDVQRSTLKPDGDAGQVEHVTIKKKNKCQCCVIS